MTILQEKSTIYNLMLLLNITVALLQVVTDADDWSKQDGLLLLFLLRSLTRLPAVSVFPVQSC